MSEKKTIHINPELFSFSKNTTKKKREKADPEKRPQIKVKTNNIRPKTLRNNVMKMIRENQEKALKNLLSDKTPIENPANPIDDFQKEFDQSLDFFSKLAQKKEQEIKQAKPNIHNSTLKHYPVGEPSSLLLQPPLAIPKIDTNENVQLEFPPEFAIPPINQREPAAFPIRPRIALPPPPAYSSLKNGTLPTYRTWKQQTQRVYPQIESPMENPIGIPPPPKLQSTLYDNPSIEKAKAIGIMKTKERIQKDDIKKSGEKKNKLRYMKRKKIYKRTYHVGRSKISPKIGVLISNKTIRNRTTEQTHMLRQIPIQEVRKYLIKKGFIKVGTTAPNDVLRKMYESVLLICGDVQNHNPENLLYNFMNDTSDK